MVRLIARLDIKGPNLIKGVAFEGLRVIGDPQEHALRYYQAGADELIYVDTVASLYGRNNLSDIVRYTVANVFIPFTVGGGVRDLHDVETLLRSGADKVSINTAALARPELVHEVALRFGSQCMVVSIEAKRIAPEKWEAYANNGRDKTGIDAVEWAKRVVGLGAGEILLTSVDQEGSRKGFDVELVRRIASDAPIPVIASGGMGSVDHLLDVVRRGHADAVAMADILHYKRMELRAIREGARGGGLEVRAA